MKSPVFAVTSERIISCTDAHYIFYFVFLCFFSETENSVDSQMTLLNLISAQSEPFSQKQDISGFLGDPCHLIPQRCQ